MIPAQAFFYNAIFFTALRWCLTDFYGIPADQLRLVHPAVYCGRKFQRPAGAGPAVRHCWVPPYR